MPCFTSGNGQSEDRLANATLRHIACALTASSGSQAEVPKANQASRSPPDTMARQSSRGGRAIAPWITSPCGAAASGQRHVCSGIVTLAKAIPIDRYTTTIATAAYVHAVLNNEPWAMLAILPSGDTLAGNPRQVRTGSAHDPHSAGPFVPGYSGPLDHAKTQKR